MNGLEISVAGKQRLGLNGTGKKYSAYILCVKVEPHNELYTVGNSTGKSMVKV
jgi:hypothetical protein